MTVHILQGDARRLPFANNTFDLVMGSPPYMDARTYGIGIRMKVDEWIEFMLQCSREAVRVSKGLVLWVVGGVTRQRNYWPGCEGLIYRWWQGGGLQEAPAYFHRIGICGSGGDQWLAKRIEYVVAFKKVAKLPYADNTACGQPPAWAPGGEMSHRLTDGTRRNQWGRNEASTEARRANGKRRSKARPSHVEVKNGGSSDDRASNGELASGRRCSRGKKNGDVIEEDKYMPPVLANPGNVFFGKVGGGKMGDKRCHENEAPYPESLVEYFLLPFCPEKGIVLDPFGGSGTTAAVAVKHGRRAVSMDVRENQCVLTRRRCAELQGSLFMR